jgi:hypothetical protein
MLPADALRCSPRAAGRLIARVPLLEILCAGAAPAFAAAPICDGGETAKELIAGIKDTLGDIPVIFSTEKNMPAPMTAFGVSVTGVCAAAALRIGGARRGDVLYMAGLPLVGGEVMDNPQKLISCDDIRSLLADRRVHAVIPAGSGGAAAEALVIAAESRLIPVMDKAAADIYKSAGPAACAVFAAERGFCPACGTQCVPIGRLE